LHSILLEHLEDCGGAVFPSPRELSTDLQAAFYLIGVKFETNNNNGGEPPSRQKVQSYLQNIITTEARKYNENKKNKIYMESSILHPPLFDNSSMYSNSSILREPVLQWQVLWSSILQPFPLCSYYGGASNGTNTSMSTIQVLNEHQHQHQHQQQQQQQQQQYNNSYTKKGNIVESFGSFPDDVAEHVILATAPEFLDLSL